MTVASAAAPARGRPNRLSVRYALLGASLPATSAVRRAVARVRAHPCDHGSPRLSTIGPGVGTSARVPCGYGGFAMGTYYGGYYPLARLLLTCPCGLRSGDDIGELRLQVSPRSAQVYVDGGYAGTVDDYDGTFQSLKLESGPLSDRVSQAPGYETIEFDVRITPTRRLPIAGDLSGGVARREHQIERDPREDHARRRRSVPDAGSSPFSDHALATARRAPARLGSPTSRNGRWRVRLAPPQHEQRARRPAQRRARSQSPCS